MPRHADVGSSGLDVLDLPGDRANAALLLLHEGLGSIGRWRGLPEELSQLTGRRVIAYSRYGHGNSAPLRAPRGKRLYRDEALRVLPELMAGLGISEPILIGHSDGASIALTHAADYPVAGLVLIAPHVFVEQITVDAIRATREEYVARDLRERMARHHGNPDAAFWGWCDMWLDPGFLQWNLDAETSRVTAPTLLIQGTEDPYGTLEQLERIKAHIPHARRFLVPGEHNPHLEHRAEVLAAIVDFVDRL